MTNEEIQTKTETCKKFVTEYIELCKKYNLEFVSTYRSFDDEFPSIKVSEQRFDKWKYFENIQDQFNSVFEHVLRVQNPDFFLDKNGVELHDGDRVRYGRNDEILTIKFDEKDGWKLVRGEMSFFIVNEMIEKVE